MPRIAQRSFSTGRRLLFSPSARREVESLLETFHTLNETERLIALLTILRRLSRDAKPRPLGGLSARIQLNQLSPQNDIAARSAPPTLRSVSPKFL